MRSPSRSRLCAAQSGGRPAPAPRSRARGSPRPGPQTPRAPRGAAWRELGCAFAADPDDGRVGEVRTETLLRAQTPAERLEGAERDLLLRSAAPADEVPVPRRIGAMPAGHAIVEMRVGDVPETRERLEVAVDGGGIDLRMARADLARDLLGGRVVPSALERVEHQPALDRHPLSLGADLVRHAHFVSCSISRLRLETRSGWWRGRGPWARSDRSSRVNRSSLVDSHRETAAIASVLQESLLRQLAIASGM